MFEIALVCPGLSNFLARAAARAEKLSICLCSSEKFCLRKIEETQLLRGVNLRRIKSEVDYLRHCTSKLFSLFI